MTEHDGEAPLLIRDDLDLVTARQRVRTLGARAGMDAADVEAVATALTEIGRNMLVYAGGGTMWLRLEATTGGGIMHVVARDEGPGIVDVSLALQDGYSSAGSLGLGLPSAKRLMDDVTIETAPGKGTTVTMRKRLRLAKSE